jgi:alkanesulfonate monooxygenase SsuD/methylene tetrahydromethanopterin reductase-like flavin-dependent oxidoreductase (luciferase family)
MKFGIFDHVDDSGVPLAQHYATRLKLVEAMDGMEFYSYHVAEHHGTPLGLAPSPNIYLSAVAQRTRRLRFGPMVYVAALYHPLRLAEEICMLDQMSAGRLQVGLGRGAVWPEQELYGIDRNEIPERYAEARDALLEALRSDRLNFTGKYFNFRDVPMVMRPLQRPHPPLWYGVANPDSTVWAAANDVNVASLLSNQVAASCISRYRQEWAALGKAESALPFLGLMRQIVVGETDQEALRIARAAFPKWRTSFTQLWEQRGVVFPLEAMFARDWDRFAADGRAIAGSARTVREFLADQIAETGANFILAQMVFGTLGYDDALHSLKLFSRDVIPALTAR